MKELEDKVIKEIYVNDDQSIIKFITDQEELCFLAVGDCCSESWFADILFDYNFFNQKVTKVEEIEIPEFINKMANKDNRGRQDSDVVYGFRLETKSNSGYIGGGGCDIIFRNSSNGYYGGWCEYMCESKWNTERLEDSVWTKITSDWSA